MPNQNSASTLSKTLRAAVTVAAVMLLVLSASGIAQAALQETSANDSSILATYGIAIIIVLFLVGLVVYKRIYPSKKAVAPQAKSSGRTSRSEISAPISSRIMTPDPLRLGELRAQALEGVQVWEKPQPVEAEPSVFGAYRVDQEVGKLVLGKAHRMDVMASRASDDRRAIEASLVKALESSDAGEEGRRRAREALDEYGFVARQSALMLMGRDAWERSSAARALGQIGSPSSLAFLIEALHDGDSVVRNQAVSSLGELKMPAAIGALLDIARRHPDIPASLLSESLSACSVESVGYLDASSSEPAMLGDGNSNANPPEPASLMSFEDLPAGNEEAGITEALTRLEDPDEHVRAQAVRELAAYPVQRSVMALSKMALNDPDSAIRSAAVSGLGAIDHESVFATVLVALADDSREVRAAAARTLSGLHFDRADAYVRVMETADAEILQAVARACIKTGIASQATDRLASEDRHQAYEAFSLFSLLARANETEPIIDAIKNHKDEEVQLCAVRVLNVAAHPDLTPKLREMVGVGEMPENVRTAVLEVLYKLDQEQPIFDLNASDNSSVSLHNSP